MPPHPVVLVVEDHMDTGVALARLVRAAGFPCLHVHSGEAALRQVASDVPSLVLLDLMMPGIDGLEVLRQLRANPRTAAVPVVMLSAVTDPQMHEHAREKGANDFWVKGNVDYGKLGDLLARHITRA